MAFTVEGVTVVISNRLGGGVSNVHQMSDMLYRSRAAEHEWWLTQTS